MNGTTIVSCDCISSYQDEIYSKGRRVANYKGGNDSTSTKCICTVCGKEHQAGSMKQVIKTVKTK